MDEQGEFEQKFESMVNKEFEGATDKQGNPKLLDGVQEMDLVKVTFEYENMNEEGDVVKTEINFTIPRKSFGRSPDYQVEAAKKKMIREILKDLKRRFDGFQQNVAGFQMVHQKQNLVSLRKNLAFVAPFFQHLGFDTEKAGNEFTAFQIILATFTEKRSIEENLQLIREKDWPNIEMIFMGSLCLPLDNAMSERGFSTMNDIKTPKRNKLMDALFALMLLSIYGKDFDFNYVALGVQIASTWTYE